MNGSGAALPSDFVLKLFGQATELIHGMSERDLAQVQNYIQKHTAGRIKLEDFEKGLEELGFVKLGKFTSHGEKPAHGKGQWQERLKPLARRAEIDEDTVSTEVKTLPKVREYTKALATAQGLHTQELIEQLMVNAINNNPELVHTGEKYLKRFKGNIAAARRYAIDQKLSNLEALQTSSPTPSRS